MLKSIGLAKVAEKVFSAQMEEQRVLVDEPLLTKLTQGVPAVRGVVGVALPTVRRQLRASVETALVGEILRKSKALINTQK